MDNEQLHFISEKYNHHLEQLTPESKAVWGKMNAQQMVEHLADFYDIAAGKIKTTLLTPVEHLPKYREFLLSDKMFRENTKAPAELMGEEPAPVKLADLHQAKARLAESVAAFKTYFENAPQAETVHPVFGMLSYSDWTRLHYKHLVHHLKQFSLIQSAQ